MASLTAKPRRRTQSSITLSYLDIKGFAEPIRLALAIGHVPFEDRRVSYEDVARMRRDGMLPYGQVPLLEVDGVRHGQSGAILRWAGRKAGLYPLTDENAMLTIDATMETIADIHKCLIPAWYKHACGRSPSTGQLYDRTKLKDEQNEGVFEALNNDILPVRFKQLDTAMVSSGGPFLCGSTMTVADLSLYVLMCGIQDGSFCSGVSPNVLNSCPYLLELLQRVAHIPEVAMWESAHQ